MIDFIILFVKSNPRKLPFQLFDCFFIIIIFVFDLQLISPEVFILLKNLVHLYFFLTFKSFDLVIKIFTLDQKFFDLIVCWREFILRCFIFFSPFTTFSIKLLYYLVGVQTNLHLLLFHNHILQKFRNDLLRRRKLNISRCFPKRVHYFFLKILLGFVFKQIPINLRRSLH